MSAYSNLGMLQPLEIRKGATFSILMYLFVGPVADGVAYDMTGCEVRAVVRARAGGQEWAFASTPPSALGSVELSLSPEVSESIPSSPVSLMAAPIYDWFCDIKLADGTIIPFAYGPARLVEGGPEWNP